MFTTQTVPSFTIKSAGEMWWRKRISISPFVEKMTENDDESKTGVKKSILRMITLVIGSILATITILPFPWRVRCAWARVLTFGRNIVFWCFKKESIHGFLGAQNIEYRLGKQDSGLYTSIKQLGMVLEFMEYQNISIEQLKAIIELLEKENVPFEQLKSIFEFMEKQGISFSQIKSITEFAEK